ncbi:hypothetical protein [Thermosyntropha sp.]|uniref:hypothetical protein n=1 Tax=Thermosyntropha sp. TaxID=2740820 RepID=UPI0025FA042A|nr:hypothetical protein [Thermosyntropha sp.]MBO8158705.1 hypothetical protein [Thermosyntropha sp.]
MLKDIILTFHNRGLRSFIEVDLCPECPRQDHKGCCGYYSPVFYPTDFAYIMQNKPKLLNYIFSIPNLTILDSSVTVNSTIDKNGYLCHFHDLQKGCTLPQDLRETICRHFVCPGIGWEKEPELKHWKEFFQNLFDYEIYLNNLIADKLKAKGLSLRDHKNRRLFFQELLTIFIDETRNLPDFFNRCPPLEKFTLTRSIKFGTDWPL